MRRRGRGERLRVVFHGRNSVMCGIVGYVGKRPVQDLLLAGLTRLEYRGYDSAGISMIAGDAIESVRAVGNLDHLREAVSSRTASERGGVAVAKRAGATGSRHTPWATHRRGTADQAPPPQIGT